MGLAASQLLYLQKTARMNDIELEAFKINTARTQLSQESNQIGEMMAGLDLPVPPSMNDYTQIQYTFTIGTDNMTIENVRPNGTLYSVTTAYERVGHYMDGSNGSYQVTRDDDNNYWVGSTQLYLMNDDSNLNIPETEMNGYIDAIRHTFPDEYGEATDEQIKNDFYVYRDPASRRNLFHFMRRTDVESNLEHTPQGADITAYDYIANGTYTERVLQSECQLEFDSSGRITQISLPSYDSNNNITRWTNYPVTSQTISDEEGYNDAYNEYQYKKYKYDQDQVKLEHEVNLVQERDKKLELLLNRLTNEREAIKTELDSVKEVIKNNIETSFKFVG